MNDVTIGNRLTLVDFSKGFYTMDESANVTGVSADHH
jgi:hypothetical protein